MTSGSAPSGGSNKKLESDVEINIASIIDCFTILITYLLAVGSYLSLGILDAGIATTSSASPAVQEGAQSASAPSVTLSLELHADHQLLVRLQGAKDQVLRVPASASGEWEIDTAVQHLKDLKTQNPEITQLVLVSDNAVQYLDLVKVADTARKILPIFLASGESI